MCMLQAMGLNMDQTKPEGTREEAENASGIPAVASPRTPHQAPAFAPDVRQRLQVC